MSGSGHFTGLSQLFFFELPFLPFSHFYVGLVVFARVELAFIHRALQLFGHLQCDLLLSLSPLQLPHWCSPA